MMIMCVGGVGETLIAHTNVNVYFRVQKVDVP